MAGGAPGELDSFQRGHEARREALQRRLRDAQAIMGCGDTPDVGAAAEECERLERALADLGVTRASRGWAPC
ncbi:MAG: hypothetical protein IT299_09220 [Dehalococcoidia bacterium]|nr:hypothetical protein [Dehalococcoidia bacterium]